MNNFVAVQFSGSISYVTSYRNSIIVLSFVLLYPTYHYQRQSTVYQVLTTVGIGKV